MCYSKATPAFRGDINRNSLTKIISFEQSKRSRRVTCRKLILHLINCHISYVLQQQFLDI